MKDRKMFVQLAKSNKEATKALLLENDFNGAINAFTNFDELKDLKIIQQIKTNLELVPDHLLSRLTPRQYYPFAQYLMYENALLDIRTRLGQVYTSSEAKFVTIGLLFVLLSVKAPQVHFSVSASFTPDTGVKFKAGEAPYIAGYLKVLRDDPAQIDHLYASLKGTDGKLSSMMVLSDALNEYRGPRKAVTSEAKVEAQNVSPSAFKAFIQACIDWVKDLIQLIKDKLNPVARFTEAPAPTLSSLKPR